MFNYLNKSVYLNKKSVSNGYINNDIQKKISN